MTLNLIILKDFNAGKLLDEFSKIQYFIQKLFKVSSIPELLEKVTVQNTFICGKSIFESNIIINKFLFLDEGGFLCKTCAVDSSCTICTACFKNSNHEGHQYEFNKNIMGCCDCGDVNAW